MCHGVETRLPFLDHKFVEASLSLTISRMVGGRKARNILKNRCLAFSQKAFRCEETRWDFLPQCRSGLILQTIYP